MSTHAASASSGDGVSDGELGGDILSGCVSTAHLLVLTVCLMSGIGLGNSLAVSVLPCALSGVFFGGVIPLSRQMARHEAIERDSRPAIALVPAVAAVVPAA